MANPYNHPSAESFLKPFTREEIDLKAYQDRNYLRMYNVAFIEQFYNPGRLHSVLGYHSPEEFEQADSSAPPPATGATMRFFRPRALARAASSARDQAEATEVG